MITKYYAENRERAYKTLANYRTVLNQIMTYAVAKGLIAFNPVQYAQLPSGARREKREAASEADEQRISFDTHLLPNHAEICVLMYQYGTDKNSETPCKHWTFQHLQGVPVGGEGEI